ncbi:MAG: hypothetical protein ACK5YR_01345 [Pirellula sp.]|jgi:hypothetical protein
MNKIRFGELFAICIVLTAFATISGCDPVQVQNDLDRYKTAVGGCSTCQDNCNVNPVSPAGNSGCQDTGGATVTIDGKTYPAYCLCSCQAPWGAGDLSCSWNPNAHIPKLERLVNQQLEVLE